MIRRPPRSTPLYSSAASDVYKRQPLYPTSHRTLGRIEFRNHVRVETPFLARTTPINEGIRAKIRFWSSTRYPKVAAWVPSEHQNIVKNRFWGVFNRFSAILTIPEQFQTKVEKSIFRLWTRRLAPGIPYMYTRCTHARQPIYQSMCVHVSWTFVRLKRSNKKSWGMTWGSKTPHR